MFALCSLVLKCKALGEDRGITCGQNEPIHPFCFPVKSAGQLLDVHTWFLTGRLHFAELTSLASSGIKTFFFLAPSFSLCLDFRIKHLNLTSSLSGSHELTLNFRTVI